MGSHEGGTPGRDAEFDKNLQLSPGSAWHLHARQRLRTTVLTTLKMDVVAPIASAMSVMDTSVSQAGGA